MNKEEIREKLLNNFGITEVIKLVAGLDPVNVTRGRGNYLCPLHKGDKTPSFVTYNDKTFHCFGCAATGDIIKFVQIYKGISQLYAIKYLCNLFSIEEPTVEKESKPRLKYQAILKDIATSCSKMLGYKTLSGKTAAEEYRKRGFNSETCQKFGLGYAPFINSGKFKKYLVTKYGEFDYQKLGLIDELGNFVLKNRLIIPILDQFGNYYSLVGRATDPKDTVKYRNLTKNEYQRKGANLYLYNLASKNDTIFLCEGQFDAISYHLSGIENCVAVGGKDISEEQFDLLEGKELILAYDNDNAGASSNYNIIKSNNNISFKVAILPKEFKDANEAFVAKKFIPYEIVSDLEFIAMYAIRLYPIEKDKDKAFDMYLNAVRERNISLVKQSYGINPVNFMAGYKILDNYYHFNYPIEIVFNFIYKNIKEDK